MSSIRNGAPARGSRTSGHNPPHRRKHRHGWHDAYSRCERLEPRLLTAADVLTYHNDNMRTGQNLSETILTPANVNPTSFGKVGQMAVDGAVYAQPLYKANVNIPGKGTHNVVFVATEHDSVYAFDADTDALLWHDSFIDPAAGITTVPSADVKMGDLTPEIGITSTPVIDPTTNTLYVVDSAKAVSGGSAFYFQQLHALGLGTGGEKFGGPVNIQATVRGRGAGSVRGSLSFNAKVELQRSGLLLVDGVVYITWASYADNGPYHGWIIGYAAQGLKQVAVFNDTPNGKQGGIWMSGGGLAADASNNIYAVTGNGTFDANPKGKDYGDTVLKLSAPQALAVADYFTPFNQAHLSSFDLDLGSGGVMLLPDQPGPHPHLLVTAGKQGLIYVIDRDNMGRFSRKTDRIVQELPNAMTSSFDTPAYFNGTIYYVGAASRDASKATGSEVLQAYKVVNGRLTTSPTLGSFAYGYPGSTPSISANGSANGIVWTLDNTGAATLSPAILRAYDANDVTHELYDSKQAGSRDQAGTAVKFTVPTVVNGKVFVGGQGVVTVYDLLPNT